MLADRSAESNQQTAGMMDDLEARSLTGKYDVTRTENIKVALHEAVELGPMSEFCQALRPLDE